MSCSYFLILCDLSLPMPPPSLNLKLFFTLNEADHYRYLFFFLLPLLLFVLKSTFQSCSGFPLLTFPPPAPLTCRPPCPLFKSIHWLPVSLCQIHVVLCHYKALYDLTPVNLISLASFFFLLHSTFCSQLYAFCAGRSTHNRWVHPLCWCSFWSDPSFRMSSNGVVPLNLLSGPQALGSSTFIIPFVFLP